MLCDQQENKNEDNKRNIDKYEENQRFIEGNQQIVAQEDSQIDGYFQIFCKLLLLLIPTAICLIIDFIPNIVHIIALLQKVEFEEMSAFIYSQLFIIITSNLYLLCIRTNIETMVSYLYGGKQFDQSNIFYQRSILIFVTIFSIHILILAISRFLFQLILDQSLSVYAGNYCLMSIPSLFFYGLNFITRSFLFSNQQYIIPLITAIIILPQCFVLDYYFITISNLGLKGVAIINFIIYFEQYLLSIILVKAFTIIKITFLKIDFKQATAGWQRYAQIGGPLGLGLFVDFIALIIISYLVDSLQDQKQSQAYNIIKQIINIYQIIITALTIIIATNTSIYIAKKHTTSINHLKIVVFSLAALISFIEILPFLTIYEDKWIHMMVTNYEQAHNLRQYLPEFILIVVLYNFLQCYAAFLRAVGEEQSQFNGYLYMHLLITLPTAYFLGIYFNGNLQSILVSQILGTYCITIWFIFTSCTFKIKQAENKIQNIIKKELKDDQQN